MECVGIGMSNKHRNGLGAMIYDKCPWVLWPGQYIENQGVRLSMHTNGNLELSFNEKHSWSSGTSQGMATCILQGDGNLVLYNTPGICVGDYKSLESFIRPGNAPWAFFNDANRLKNTGTPYKLELKIVNSKPQICLIASADRRNPNSYGSLNGG